MALTGEDIMNSLSALKGAASITEIVAHFVAQNKGSETSLMEVTKALIQAGVQFGCILEEDNKYRCKESLKYKEAIDNKNTETEKLATSNSNDTTSSSSGRVEKSKTKKRKAINGIEEQNISSEDEEEFENDADESADCYGPSYRRRRSRSRSRRRNRSGKRLSSRRKRRYR